MDGGAVAEILPFVLVTGTLSEFSVKGDTEETVHLLHRCSASTSSRHTSTPGSAAPSTTGKIVKSNF